MGARKVNIVTSAVVVLLVLGTYTAGGLGSRDGAIVFEAGWPAQLIAAEASIEHSVLLFWRAPRIVAALVVGFALAVAGLLLQGITRNPLADPYLLGVSGGAGLCVVLLQSIPAVATHLPWWSTPIAAFGGALLAMYAVMVLARGSGGRLSLLSLILAGVVINALCAALMAFLLARFDPFRLRITSSWLAGGIAFASWPSLAAISALGLLAWLLLRAQAHRLNAFALGLQAAATVGVDSDKMMRRGAVIASVLAAFGVSLAGLLGYVGLIVPHAVRLVLRSSDFRATLPLTAVSGALLVLVADTAARLLFAPEELPVGVLTALMGCPVLLVQLRAQLRMGR